MDDRIFTKNLESIVEHGLDSINPDEIVEVNLKDLMYVKSVLQEYMRFFHQPLHYQQLSDVTEFLGTMDDKAGFKILNEAVYKKMYSMIPEHIGEMANNGEFDAEELPFYYNENRHET